MTPAEFRRLCGHFATGVTILTTRDSAGAPCGMTANSFTAVSLDPPLVSVSVDHAATIHEPMQGARHFTINILEVHQEALSRRFAESLDERFEGVAWHVGEDDQVILDGALAHLSCEKWAEVPAGDHTIFIGRVTRGAAGDGEPLVHFRGGYPD